LRSREGPFGTADEVVQAILPNCEMIVEHDFRAPSFVRAKTSSARGRAQPTAPPDSARIQPKRVWRPATQATPRRRRARGCSRTKGAYPGHRGDVAECVSIPMARLHREKVRRVLDWIVAGEFEPGEKLPTEVELQASLGISREAVREIIRALDEGGVVSVSHGSGATVEPSEHWNVLDPVVLAALLPRSEGRRVLLELTECRGVLELAAAELAAEHASDPALDEIAAAVDALDALPQRSYTKRGRAEIAVHRALVRAAGHAAIARTLLPVLDATEVAASVLGRRKESGKEHRQIAKALCARDAELAAVAVSQHFAAVHGDIARDMTPEPMAFIGVPKTADQETRLIEGDVDFWEYRLFAGALYQGREALEFKYRDRKAGIDSSRVRLNVHDANRVLQHAIHRVAAAVGTIEQILSPTAQQRAFGPPGEPGDAAAIRHLAQRVVSVYEELLDTAAQLRSIEAPGFLQPAFRIASRYTDAPIAQFRRFIATAIDELEGVPERATDVVEPRTIRPDLVLRLDAAIQRELDAEMKRMRRKIRWTRWTGGDLDARST
jgi:DNA-binding FadR family transcriptional regulator